MSTGSPKHDSGTNAGDRADRLLLPTEAVVTALTLPEIEDAIRYYQVRQPDGRIVRQFHCFGLGPEYFHLLMWCMQPRMIADIAYHLARLRYAAAAKPKDDILGQLDVNEAREMVGRLIAKGLVKFTDAMAADRLPITSVICATSFAEHPEHGNTDDTAATRRWKRLGLTDAHRRLLLRCAGPTAVVELAAEADDHAFYGLILDLLRYGFVAELDADLFNRSLYKKLLSDLRSMGAKGGPMAPDTTASDC